MTSLLSELGAIAGAAFAAENLSADFGQVQLSDRPDLAQFQCNGALAAETQVLLLRGWFGVFSTGMDGLAAELKAKGIKTEVAGHLYWSTAVKEILKERAAGKNGALVLVGHSQGANNVIDMARSLEPHKVSVDLLVTLAPFM